MKTVHARWLLATCCLWSGGALAAAPLDAGRLIADSSQLQKAPEPEMTESERAVYEKVAPILTTKPAFALRLLKAMSTTSDPNAKPSPAFDFMLGNAYYAAGNYPEAEAKYRSAVERNPTFVRAWNNLGVLYHVQAQHADAVPCFSQSVALGYRDATTFGLLGNSLEKTGNTVSAEMAYMQALAAEPANVNWSEGLLRIYIAGQQYAKAETLVRALLAGHSEDARYWATYAHLLLSSDRKLEATALLERMAATGLTREADLILLGDLYAEQRMTTEALANFARVATTQPELAERRLLQLAKTLSSERLWAEALIVLETLAKKPLTPQSRIAYLESRAELELARKNSLEAKRAFEALLAEAPANGNAWIGLGRVYLAEAEPTKAIAAFEHACEIPDSSYRASIELSNIEFKNHNYERCLRHLERALGIRRTASVENFRDQIRNLIPSEKQPRL
ncbi:MAG: tetratricopeptide repeat protein [Opitutae bacterium]|nr:tetratricopeptide repeat protein [Opitutae bacterium]